jgi:hypothetical protein
MSKLIQKKPTYLQTTLGVDKKGQNGLTVFKQHWLSSTYDGFVGFIDCRAHSGGAGAILWGPALALVLYGAAQLAEHNWFNERPAVQVDESVDPFDLSHVSFAMFHPDPDLAITARGTTGSEQYMALRNEDETYTAFDCDNRQTASCRVMTPHEVNDLKVRFQQWANDESEGFFARQIDYLDPAFLMHFNISSLSVPVMKEEVSNVFFEDEFHVEHEEPFRVVENDDSKHSDGTYLRLSQRDEETQQTIRQLWEQTLNAPSEGNYHFEDSEGAQVWPRIEGDEWDDAWFGENAFLNVIGFFGLVAIGAAAMSAPGAVRDTRRQVKQIKGLELLKLEKK